MYFWSKFVIFYQKIGFWPNYSQKFINFSANFSIDKIIFLNKIYWQPGSMFCQRECIFVILDLRKISKPGQDSYFLKSFLLNKKQNSNKNLMLPSSKMSKNITDDIILSKLYEENAKIDKKIFSQLSSFFKYVWMKGRHRNNVYWGDSATRPRGDETRQGLLFSQPRILSSTPEEEENYLLYPVMW